MGLINFTKNVIALKKEGFRFRGDGFYKGETGPYFSLENVYDMDPMTKDVIYSPKITPDVKA